MTAEEPADKWRAHVTVRIARKAERTARPTGQEGIR